MTHESWLKETRTEQVGSSVTTRVGSRSLLYSGTLLIDSCVIPVL